MYLCSRIREREKHGRVDAIEKKGMGRWDAGRFINRLSIFLKKKSCFYIRYRFSSYLCRRNYRGKMIYYLIIAFPIYYKINIAYKLKNNREVNN